MVSSPTSHPQLPISTGAVDGILHIQHKANLRSSWEFCVKKSAMAGNIASYPKTRSNCPEGIECTLKHKEFSCPAAYHGDARGIYIGSRGWKKRHLTPIYRRFLETFGISVGVTETDVPVRLHFRPDNTVYVCRRQGLSGTCTTSTSPSRHC